MVTITNYLLLLLLYIFAYKCFTTKDRVSISLIFIITFFLSRYLYTAIFYFISQMLVYKKRIAILFSLNCLFVTSNPDNDHVIIVVYSFVYICLHNSKKKKGECRLLFILYTKYS